MQTMKSMPIMNEPTDDEVAAALAAVQIYLAAEYTASEPASLPSRQQWTESAKLVVQGLRPARTATALRWNAVERLRRNRGGAYGVVGL
jgi:hypothetical protein